ncbi:MAG: hypothetical protein ACK41E_06885 [Deinococcales bacterium]
MKKLLIYVCAALFAACAPQNRTPKVCPPEPTTPIISSATTPDTDPDPFCFSDVTQVDPDPTQAVSSNSITVRGINRPAPIRSSNQTVLYVNDQYLEYFYENTPSKTVNPGDKVRVLVSPSNRSGETVTATVTIGTVSSTFSVTTK